MISSFLLNTRRSFIQNLKQTPNPLMTFIHCKSSAPHRFFFSEKTITDLNSLPLIGNTFQKVFTQWRKVEKLPMVPEKTVKQFAIELSQIKFRHSQEAFIQNYCSTQKSEDLAFELLDMQEIHLLGRNITQFKLSQESLKEIILSLEKIDPDYLCMYMDDIKILDTIFVSDLAFRLVKSTPSMLCHCVDRFKLSKEVVFNLALDLAKQSPETLIKEFDKFQLEEEEKKKVILALLDDSQPHLKKIAQALAYYSKSLKIEDQTFIIKFCIRLIALNKDSPLYYTANACCDLIKEEKRKVEIVFNFANSDPKNLCESIHLFKIKDEEIRKKLALMTAKIDSESLCHNIKRFAITDQGFLKACGLEILKTCPTLLKSYAESLDLSRETLSSIITEYEDTLLTQGISKEENRLIYKKIGDYRNKDIALFLFIKHSINTQFGTYLTFYKELCSKTKDSTLLTHAILPAICLSSWLHECNEEIPEETKTILLEFLHSSSNRLAFRNPIKSPLMQNFLLACIALEEDNSLYSYSKEKLHLLAQACKSPDAVEVLPLLAIFCKKHEGQDLLNQEMTVAKLTELLENRLIEDSYADISNIPNVINAYKGTFGSSMIARSLKTYEIGLRTLGDAEVKNDHTRFVRSVLLGDKVFKQERYRTDINANLRAIESKRPQILEKWKQPISHACEDQITVIETDDPITLLEAPTLARRTCQSIDSPVAFNKCLISFCIDGGIRMVVAQDASKKTIAFRILRIVQNDKGEPALLLEPPYYTQIKRNVEICLETVAIQKADSLGCSILTTSHLSHKFGPSRTARLRNEGGSCKFTYSDLMGGLSSKESTETRCYHFKEHPFSSKPTPD